jgi:hypothetical protein
LLYVVVVLHLWIATSDAAIALNLFTIATATGHPGRSPPPPREI